MSNYQTGFALVDLPAKGARVWPERAALAWGGDSNTLTFAELEDRVARLVTVLAAAGVRTGTRIGLLAPNCPQQFELFFACAHLGAVLVPLNVRLAPREIAYQIGDAEMTHAVIHPDLDVLASASGLAALEGWRLGDAYDAAIFSAARSDDHPQRNDSAALMQMYTSGTTGQAKGCVQSAGAWLQSALNFGFGLRLPRHASLLSGAPYFHAFGFGIALAHLVVGGTVPVLRTFQGNEFWSEFDRYQPHSIVPTRSLPADGLPRPCVQVVIGQAGQYRPSSGQFIHEFFPNGEYFGVYGLTEATNIVMLSTEQEEIDHPGTLGQPLPGIDVMVANESGIPTRAGEVGELLLRGGQMCSGYWANPTATEDLFVGGWLHTGDLARRDADGTISFEDRSKDMIKSGGENVYSAEVERVLVASDLVVEAAVLGVPDPRWTEVVKAVVVLREPSVESIAALDEHCRATIAAYKRPRLYELVEQLPRNHSNKVLKAELRADHDLEKCIRIEELPGGQEGMDVG